VRSVKHFHRLAKKIQTTAHLPFFFQNFFAKKIWTTGRASQKSTRPSTPFMKFPHQNQVGLKNA
jgi:hypothetical protein